MDVPDQFSDTAPGQRRLQVNAPGQPSRWLDVTARTLTVGRSRGSDLVLDDPKVALQHASIEFDGREYQVRDLNDASGSTYRTFLGDIPLLPGVPEKWPPDKPLRIGDYWLRQVPSQPAEPSGKGQEQVAVNTTGELEVEPGGSIRLPLVVINQGSSAHTFGISLDGIPRNWMLEPRPPLLVRLNPGEQRPLQVIIHPPLSPQSRAGRYALTIRVASHGQPEVAAQATTSLTVRAFHEFRGELQPPRIQARRPAAVIVQNQGNAPQTFDLRWRDRTDELTFKPSRAQLEVREGKEGSVRFRAVPRQRRWIGGEVIHSISVQISPATGEAQTLAGEVTNRALIPTWLPLMLIFMCLVLAAAGGLAYGVVSFQRTEATAQAVTTLTARAAATLTAVPTATPTPTPNLLATAGIIAQQTITAQQKAAAQAAQTVAAATATAATAAAQVGQTATAATAAAQVGQTATAATAAAQAGQTATAATAAAQTATAITATVQAAQTATAQAGAAMDAFLGDWTNVDANTNGMTRLVIEKVDDKTVSFHGFGKCHPTDCDWQVINVPFTPPTLVGTYDFGFKQTLITVKLAGNQLLAETFDHFTDNSGRADRTDNYVLER